MAESWIILGAGYVGSRLARALRRDGHQVLAVSRHVEKLAPLAAIGCKVMAADAAKQRAFMPVFYGQTSPYVLFSIPPIPMAPAGSAVQRAAEVAALAGGCRKFIYLGSTAVYGATMSSEWVDENTATALSDPDGAPRIADEATLETIRLGGLNTCVLRLAAIYGPGRGVRERIKKGNYKLTDNGVHYFSRVHVDDIVGIVRAATQSPAGALYCVADREPSTQREYADWLCDRMGVPRFPDVGDPPYLKPVKNRRVSSDLLVKELDYKFLYPSFREGEAAIEAEAARGDEPIPAVAPVVAAPASASESVSVSVSVSGSEADSVSVSVSDADSVSAAVSGSAVAPVSAPAAAPARLAARAVPLGRNARIAITRGLVFVHKGRVEVGSRELGPGEFTDGPVTVVALLPSELFIVEG